MFFSIVFFVLLNFTRFYFELASILRFFFLHELTIKNHQKVVAQCKITIFLFL